jgi:hypothetical protein
VTAAVAMFKKMAAKRSGLLTSPVRRLTLDATDRFPLLAIELLVVDLKFSDRAG